MLLVLSITFYFITIYGFLCVVESHFSSRWLKGYIYSSCYYHHQIGSIHLSHCYHIFSVVMCLRCLLHHILQLIAHTFWENREFVFIISVQFMMSANIRIRFGLQIVLVCLYSTPSHYHQCANLSEGIELIKCLSDMFNEYVRLSIFSPLFYIQLVGLYVFNLPISLLMIERIYIYFVLLSSSNRKYELLPIFYG